MYWWILKRKIHTSWLITIFCLSISFGVFLAANLNGFSSFGYLIVSIVLSIFVFWKKTIYFIPLIICSGLLFGLWRGSLTSVDIARFEKIYGQEVRVKGIVSGDVEDIDSSVSSFNFTNLVINDEKFTGVIKVSTDNSKINRGDFLTIVGIVQKGFGSNSGAMYRAKVLEITHPAQSDIVVTIRDWFADGVKNAINEPESSLGLGFLLGQKNSLPTNLIISLQLVGLTHMIVASGYNLTILVRFARRIFVKISKYLATAFSIIMIIVFILITGLSPSMSRAGFVSLISLLAWYYGRRFHPIVLLALAIATTLMFCPNYAWGDIGWQLSFLAFAGVMIFAPLTQRYFFDNKKVGFVAQVLIETVSAQIMTAPIIIMAFGQISNVAILSNLILLPLVPLVMLLTFIAGLGGLIAPSFAGYIGLPASWLLSVMIWIVKKFAELPWVSSVIKIELWQVAIYYLIIVIICIYMSRATKYKLRDTNLVE